MDRKSKIRTKGSTRQWEFDNILADLKDDELEFLGQKYNRNLLDFRKNKDFNQEEYLEMQQRKKMIEEERRNRKLFKSPISSESEKRFYAEEGTILDLENNVLGNVAFNYDETEIISLPSGNKGKKKEEIWEPIEEENLDIEDDESFTMMSEVDMSWNDWCKKKCLHQ